MDVSAFSILLCLISSTMTWPSSGESKYTACKWVLHENHDFAVNQGWLMNRSFQESSFFHDIWYQRPLHQASPVNSPHAGRVYPLSAWLPGKCHTGPWECGLQTGLPFWMHQLREGWKT